MAEKVVRLTFSLGDLRLGGKSLRVLVPTQPLESPVPDGEVAGLLASAPPAVRGAYLAGMPVEGPLPRTTGQGPLLRYVVQHYPRCYVALSGTFEEYLQNNFSGKTRSTLKRKARKLAEHCQGRLEMRVCRTVDELREFHRLAAALSARTYQHRLMDAGLPTNAAFVEKMLRLAAEDRVRAFLLLNGERPISYLYCPAADGVLLYGYLGYDPEFADFSPGTVLHLMALESLFAEGRFRMLDFDEGGGQHKETFANVRRSCADVYYLRRTMGHRVLLSVHAFLEGLSSGAGRTLQRLGLKRFIKRLVRRTG
jgi:CelD/BcsL family acetyltransferase involved in cellulose biosynthesis